MNKLATKLLKKAIKKNSFISSVFPLEPLQIFVTGQKVIRSPTEVIYDSEKKKSAQRYYTQKNRIHSFDFELVDFHALGQVMTN